MATWQILRYLSGTEQIFLTYRAICFELSHYTFVRLEDVDGKTHTAIVTMKEILSSTNAADTAFCAMKRLR
jgi:hypothetical protein